MANQLLGFQHLAQQHGIELVQPLFSLSQLGAVRQRALTPQGETLTWPPQYAPPNHFAGHFEFGLKYERLNLEFCSRLFAHLGPADITAWVQHEPTGRYARRTAFLYEWLTGQTLPVPDTAANVAYVDAIDSSSYLSAPKPERVRRWRINNNLPGTPAFCPMVYLGPDAQRDWLFDIAASVQALDAAYGPELLLRSAAWLTFKESRASFAIEHEANKTDRVQRFAAAIRQFSGRMPEPLATPALLTLQKAVLGDKALRLGIRQSPVFVGENSFRAQVAHYIAPDCAMVPGMLAALQAYELKTRGAHPLARAAALSFAFVYLHPLADGNGRVHRFLIHHLLAADGAVPANLVVPVSATIAGSAKGRADYDSALELFSRPFMRRYADAYRFGPRRTCPDGVESNFQFLQTEDAQHAWRYPDLTGQTHYLSAVLRHTVEHEMTAEAQLLRQYDSALQALKTVIEMPDADADRIIRSLKQENWAISNKLRKAYPQLFQEDGPWFDLHAPIIQAVRAAFEPEKD